MSRMILPTRRSLLRATPVLLLSKPALAFMSAADRMLGVEEGGAPPGATTTFDPSNKNAAITLSGGNLTATNDGTAGWMVVGVTTSHTLDTGVKFHVEFTVQNDIASGSGGSQSIGLANSSGVSGGAGDAYLGQGANTIGMYVTNGDWVTGNAGFGNGLFNLSFAVNDVIAFEGDLTSGASAGTAKFSKNGGAYTSSAVTWPTGPLFLVWYCQGNASFPKVTMNCGQSAFVATPSTGYSAWG